MSTRSSSTPGTGAPRSTGTPGTSPGRSRSTGGSSHSTVTYPYALIDLGLILNNTGEFDEARARLSRALQLTEGQNLPLPRAQILYGLAAISANTGDTHNALEMLDASIRLFPSYAPAQRAPRPDTRAYPLNAKKAAPDPAPPLAITTRLLRRRPAASPRND